LNTTEYLEQSKRTAGSMYDHIHQSKNASVMNINVLHAAIGISTESGEILDALKKQIFYSKEVDKVNLAEEVGDVLWYVAMMLRELEMSFEDVMQMNINKLQKRFPDKFETNQALNRDLKTERDQLEADMKL
jgi:NTP pyrophosphatase (non-canonical NTP hydrolase)